MSIAPIAFSDHQPKVFHSIGAAHEEAFRLLPGLKCFEFANRHDFQFKTSFTRVNELHFAAISTPENRIYFGDRKDPTFIFPHVGHGHFSIEGHSAECLQHESSIFIPPGFSSEVEGAGRSVVVARLDARRLESTLATMLGQEERVGSVRFKTPAEVTLTPKGISFDRVFRAHIAQINAYLSEPSLLQASGLDDAFYRTLVLATHREVFLRQSERRMAPAHARQMARVCDYIAAEQANTITLTDLERIGHMSRRTLHNAFIKSFGMSPMAWVRERRLLEANRRLKSVFSAESVTQVLHSCGFTNASLFAAQYLRRFGELPSSTLATSRR